MGNPAVHNCFRAVACRGTGELLAQQDNQPRRRTLEIKAAVSLVAESTLFVDYIHEGRSTRPYADGHAAYLEDAVQQSLNKLKQTEPEPGTAAAVHECSAQLELLDRELSGIPAKFGDDEALAAAKERMTSIRASLEKAGSSL